MKELICIGCPMGCMLQVETVDGEVSSVTGNVCARGDRYARDEVMRPRRTVTSLIPVEGCRVPLSVKTRDPIPKDLIGAALRHIRELRVALPVKIGDVIEADFLGTGVDLVATRALDINGL